MSLLGRMTSRQGFSEGPALAADLRARRLGGCSGADAGSGAWAGADSALRRNLSRMVSTRCLLAGSFMRPSTSAMSVSLASTYCKSISSMPGCDASLRASTISHSIFCVDRSLLNAPAKASRQFWLMMWGMLLRSIAPSMPPLWLKRCSKFVRALALPLIEYLSRSSACLPCTLLRFRTMNGRIASRKTSTAWIMASLLGRSIGVVIWRAPAMRDCVQCLPKVYHKAAASHCGFKGGLRAIEAWRSAGVNR